MNKIKLACIVNLAANKLAKEKAFQILHFMNEGACQKLPSGVVYKGHLQGKIFFKKSIILLFIMFTSRYQSYVNCLKEKYHLICAYYLFIFNYLLILGLSMVCFYHIYIIKSWTMTPGRGCNYNDPN